VPGRASKVVACAAIAGIGGAAFGLYINHLVMVSDKIRSPAAQALDSAAYRQEVCFFRAIREDVPRGAAVYVQSPSQPHTQRLSEYSTGWAVPKKYRADAQWVVSIKYLGKYPPPRHRHNVTYTRCGGAILLVRHI
jgi:hypothetical protein